MSQTIEGKEYTAADLEEIRIRQLDILAKDKGNSDAICELVCADALRPFMAQSSALPRNSKIYACNHRRWRSRAVGYQRVSNSCGAPISSSPPQAGAA